MRSEHEIAAVAGVAAIAGFAYYLWRQSQNDDSVVPVITTSGLAVPAAIATNNASPLGLDFLSQVAGELGLSVPLGLKVNNPGNLRFIAQNPWNGQVGNYNGFGQYDTPENGVRAMGHQVMKYYRQGLTSVADIVSTWAPRSENDTAAYINTVCQRMGVLATSTLALPEQLAYLLDAMIRVEQGYNPFDVGDLQAWGNEV